MFNKTENSESHKKRAEKKSTFFQKSNFKTLTHYLSQAKKTAHLTQCVNIEKQINLAGSVYITEEMAPCF